MLSSRLTARSGSLPQLWASSKLLFVSAELVGVEPEATLAVGVQSFQTSVLCFSLFSAEASEIMKSIGEAIQYLHSINIAHRDVKVPPVYAP